MELTEENREKLYADFHNKVARYVAGKVPNPHDAEDLVSCVFLKVYQKLDSFDERKAAVSTWIYTIAQNTVIDYYRTRKQYSELPEDLAEESEIDLKLLNDERLEQLCAALEQLDMRSRDLIILHYYKGFTLKIVAEKMQMSYANAKVIHRRALQKLRGYLGETE